MKIESLEGIILSETNYSESSKILNVLTKEHGLIGVLSKGCRNVKSKLRGVSRKLLLGTLHIYYRPNGLSTLIGIDIINSFSKSIMDLEKISYASMILDLTYQVIRQTEDENIYDLLKNTLIKLDEGLDPMPLSNIFELKLLDFLGVSPSLDGCSECGNNTDIVTISSYRGGYLCRSCYQNAPIVSEETIKTIRMYYYVDIKSIKKLNIKKEVSKEINQFLDDYYERYTGLYIKSKDFLKRINQLNKKEVN